MVHRRDDWKNPRWELADCSGEGKLPIDMFPATGRGLCPDCGQKIILGAIVSGHDTANPIRSLAQHLIRVPTEEAT